MLPASKRHFSADVLASTPPSVSPFTTSAPDVITTLRVNHVWRRFVASALWQTFAYTAVSEQVETWIGQLLLDLYDSELGSGGALVSYANIAYLLDAGDSAGTNIADAWTQYPLNTVLSDDDSIVTLTTNQFQVAAGTFDFDIMINMSAVDGARAGLYNYTQASAVKAGVNIFGNSQRVTGRDISNGSDWYEVQYYAQIANLGDGRGRAVSSGDDEMYCDVNIYLYSEP